MLVGTGFAGAYLCTAALAVGVRRKQRQFVVGAATALGAPLIALWLGAELAFLLATVCAVPAAAGAVAFASRFGFLSRVALTTGIAALTMAAPAAALSGGAGAQRAALLFLFLWPFYCWRSLRLVTSLETTSRWNRDELRARGLREAAVTALWTTAVAVGLRLG